MILKGEFIVSYQYLTIQKTAYVTTCSLTNLPMGTMVLPAVDELHHFLDSIESDNSTRVVVFTSALEGCFIAHYNVQELCDRIEKGIEHF